MGRFYISTKIGIRRGETFASILIAQWDFLECACGCVGRRWGRMIKTAGEGDWETEMRIEEDKGVEMRVVVFLWVCNSRENGGHLLLIL
jgi:hypothetical protein